VFGGSVKTNQKEAYGKALRLAIESDLSSLAIAEIALTIATQYKLSAYDARRIAAKAVRVERGHRRKKK